MALVWYQLITLFNNVIIYQPLKRYILIYVTTKLYLFYMQAPQHRSIPITSNEEEGKQKSFFQPHLH